MKPRIQCALAVNSRFHGVRPRADVMINMGETALSWDDMSAASMQ
jgi:hypothetical protein